MVTAIISKKGKDEEKTRKRWGRDKEKMGKR
jgi:hypothetical protein